MFLNNNNVLYWIFKEAGFKSSSGLMFLKHMPKLHFQNPTNTFQYIFSEFLKEALVSKNLLIISLDFSL